MQTTKSEKLTTKKMWFYRHKRTRWERQTNIHLPTQWKFSGLTHKQKMCKTYQPWEECCWRWRGGFWRFLQTFNPLLDYSQCDLMTLFSTHLAYPMPLKTLVEVSFATNLSHWGSAPTMLCGAESCVFKWLKATMMLLDAYILKKVQATELCRVALEIAVYLWVNATTLGWLLLPVLFKLPLPPKYSHAVALLLLCLSLRTFLISNQWDPQ